MIKLRFIPLKRGTPAFSYDQIAGPKRQSLDYPGLYEAGVISKATARETFKQEGLIDFRQSLHQLEFNHCYDRVVVYSLRIPADSNFTVSRVDKIAIQDSENRWHLLNIESIEIDRLPYDAVNSGTVGIKVDRIVPGARDYYVVKVSKDKGLKDA
ncbi:hypothetical protein HFD92_14070 [Pantoea sp. EKM101V]|uniref:hypothetical protein n=1 Tax=Pantoea sp. EKM101V TaxID=1683695 RepID=UPI00142E47CA|nr:hypothetical protein [Pantoea sp. EKM101V]KAF6663782.1 hypothetical protein HFD92_14070 [Pantoea sp. EKM101V]